MTHSAPPLHTPILCAPLPAHPVTTLLFLPHTRTHTPETTRCIPPHYPKRGWSSAQAATRQSHQTTTTQPPTLPCGRPPAPPHSSRLNPSRPHTHTATYPRCLPDYAPTFPPNLHTSNECMGLIYFFYFDKKTFDLFCVCCVLFAVQCTCSLCVRYSARCVHVMAHSSACGLVWCSWRWGAGDTASGGHLAFGLCGGESSFHCVFFCDFVLTA